MHTTAGMPDKILGAMRDHTPLGRLGDAPRMSAGAYSFLASEEASFITNAVLSIDAVWSSVCDRPPAIKTPAKDQYDGIMYAA
jgi:NAD(P)-dependent dehydrogenase (short-subunit alcohol dehydrogenase family)